MAISLKDVEKTLETLQNEGVRPTIAAIQSKIGGSNNTIIKHLESLKKATNAGKSAAQAAPQTAPSLPVELVKAIADAIARAETGARADSAEQIETLQARLDAMLSEADQIEGKTEADAKTLAACQSENSRLSGICEERAVELDRLRVENDSLRASLAQSQTSAAVAEALLAELRTQNTAKAAAKAAPAVVKTVRGTKAGEAAPEATKAP